MTCKISKLKGKGNYKIECGHSPEYLPENSTFQNNENGLPSFNLYMNNLNITESFPAYKEGDWSKMILLEEIDELAEGWPGQNFYIEIIGMMAWDKYQRESKMKWKRVFAKPGMAA